MTGDLPSLSLIATQVAAERDRLNSHAESLDTKAGVVLGFAGVVVGLGATGSGCTSNPFVVRAGLVAAVICLAGAVGFVVAGMLMTIGGNAHV